MNTPENTDEDTTVSNDVNTPENTDIPDELNKNDDSFDKTKPLNESSITNINNNIAQQESHNTNEIDTSDIYNSSVHSNTNSKNYVWYYDPIKKINIKIEKPV